MQAPAPFPWPADDPLQDDALTGTMRIWQRVRGHRYSLDDVLTAQSALEADRQAESYLDLGCGISSVLMMVVGGSSTSRAFGIEAQKVSFDLAEQNVLRNQLQDRVSLVHGDFRNEPLSAAPAGGFGRLPAPLLISLRERRRHHRIPNGPMRELSTAEGWKRISRP